MPVTPPFLNFRDVGGASAVDGRQVRRGALFRSDYPIRMDGPVRDRLEDLGLARVVDLRDEAEVAAAADLFGDAGFEVVHAPVFQGSAESFVQEGFDLDRLYRHMLDESGDRLVEAVRAVSTTARGAVLVHCTVGKDRTGLVIALILGALGVHRHQIVADYARTQANLSVDWVEERVRVLSDLHGHDVSGAAELLGGSPPSAMEAVLDRLDRDWGSPAGYLGAHGLTVSELTWLRARLLATGEEAAA